MHRDDLVAGLATEFDISKARAREIMDTVFDTIADDAANGIGSVFPGFGKFDVVQRAARKFKNPLAGEGTAPAKKAFVFRPSSFLKKKVNGK